jgi:xylan 1,4-beta-xylosidase
MGTARKAFTVSCAVLVLGAGAKRAFAQAAAPAVTISVDATSPGIPIERVWAFHGFDEVNYGATDPGRALLGTLGQIHTTPPHIRNHFLLNSGDGTPSFKWGSTNVYSAPNGSVLYDWTLMDGVMDAITGAGALPYVEIGFMPHDLSVHPDPYQNSGIYTLDGGCFYPPSDYTKWAALIGAWAAHSDGRYLDVSTQWPWELWNEPDLGYWHGTPAEYDQLFDYTETGLHGVLPNARLGGPAVAAPGPFLTQFLAHTASGTNAVTGASGTRLDLISFHAKGGVAMTDGHVEMNLGNQLALHLAGFEAVAAFPQYLNTPIVISEADPDGCAACPLAENPADAYRLSPAYGAYEVVMMKRSLELEARVGVNLAGLVTWAFLFNDQPYFAGYRVLSSNGIHLPVLNAFKLLAQLDGARLPVASSGSLSLDDILASSVRGQPDVDAMATLGGTSVQVLVWNYHDDLATAPPSPVHLSVQLPASFGARALVTQRRVDDANGDAYAIWASQGSPASPSAAQLAQLQQAMEPVALQSAQPVDAPGGTVALDFDLPRFGVSLFTISAAGGGDASATSMAPPVARSGCACGVAGGGSAGSSIATGFAFVLLRRARRRRSREGTSRSVRVQRSADAV